MSNGNGASEEVQEQQGEQTERQDNISFRIDAHPITQEPLIFLLVEDRQGGRAEISLDGNNATVLGAQITSRANLLNILVHLSQVQAAMAAQQNKLFVPPHQG